jgi:hypothetical protein
VFEGLAGARPAENPTWLRHEFRMGVDRQNQLIRKSRTQKHPAAQHLGISTAWPAWPEVATSSHLVIQSSCEEECWLTGGRHRSIRRGS